MNSTNAMDVCAVTGLGASVALEFARLVAADAASGLPQPVHFITSARLPHGFNAKFIIFHTKFIIFDAEFMIFHTKFMISHRQRGRRPWSLGDRRRSKVRHGGAIESDFGRFWSYFELISADSGMHIGLNSVCFCASDPRQIWNPADGAGQSRPHGNGKNEEFCIRNEKLCIKNVEFCIKSDEICRLFP